MSKLVIVESPSKMIMLKTYLGTGYKVMASYGHIRDLPKKVLGFAAPDYAPNYVVTNPHVVNNLKAAIQDKGEVLLATAPDREGEFIAWQLKEVLRLRNPKRVDVHKFTSSAVSDAFNKPRAINENLVRAHEARRVIDRIIGYKLSNATIGLGVENGVEASINVNFHAQAYRREIEAGLDHIAQGKAGHRTVIADIVDLLTSELRHIQAGGGAMEGRRMWWPYHGHVVYVH